MESSSPVTPPSGSTASQDNSGRNVLVLLGVLLGGAALIMLLFWGVFRYLRPNTASEVRPTYSAGQSVLFALPNRVGSLTDHEIKVRNADGEAIQAMQVEVTEADGVPNIKVVNPHVLKAGTYTIEVMRNDRRVYTQDFSWGVLALNYPKSVYKPGEDVALDIAVLDEKGGMVCDAEVTLEITSPQGNTQTQSTKAGDIITHPECQLKEYVTVSDYESHFTVTDIGNYQLILTAITPNGTYQIHDYVPVEDNPAFVIERHTNTRIYPPENYPVTLTIYSRDGFQGSLSETLRSDFSLGDDHNRLVYLDSFHGQIHEGDTPPEEKEGAEEPSLEANEAQPNTNNDPEVNFEDGKLNLVWEGIEIAAGESTDLHYVFNAPDVSPQLYTIGTATLSYSPDNHAYTHQRLHQLAMDDLPPTTPVGWWKFDEGTGTIAADSSGLGNDLTLSAASWSPLGKAGTAWDGDGAKWVSRADDNDFDFTESDSFTISMWFKSDSATNPATQEWLLNKSLSGGTQQAGYAIYAKTDGTVCFGWDDDATWDPDAELCTTEDVYDGQWHQLLATKDGIYGQIRLHIDGGSIAIPSQVITAVDSTDSVGTAPSIVLGVDSYPIIAYRDTTNQDLKVAKCGNAACTSSTLTTPYATNNVGMYPSVAIGADGYPVISHYEYSSPYYFKVTKCTNLDCSASSTNNLVTAPGWFGYSSIAVPSDGYPVVVLGVVNMRVVKCGDSACTSFSNTLLDYTENAGGRNVSLAIGADDYPVFSYSYNGSIGPLKVTKCADATCSSGRVTTVVDSSPTQHSALIIGVDGYPVISYYDATNQDLKVLKCGNAACTSGNSINTVDSIGEMGQYTSIAIGADGYPVISYYDITNQDLKVAKCKDIACTEAGTFTLDSIGNVGVGISIAVGTDGYPVIAYHDQSNEDLKVVKCTSPICNGFPSTGSLANSRIMYVGDRQGADGGDEFNGDIDDVRIFRAAFSEEQARTEHKRLLSTTFGTSLGNSAGLTATGNPPVAYWKLDDNTGTTALDSSGNGFHGTLTNGPAWTVGKLGQAVRFDGSNDYITMGNQSGLEMGSSSMSVMAWVRRSSVSTDGAILSKTSTAYAAANPGYDLYQWSSANGGNTCFYYKDGVNTYETCTAPNTTTTLHEWFHIAAVLDRTNGASHSTIYINGVNMEATEMGNPTTLDSYSNALPFLVGALTTGTSRFAGDIDDVKIYNYPRTQSQVIEDMNGNQPVGGSAIGSQAGWWKMDEGSGSVLYDSSSNTNHLTLDSGTWSNEGKLGRAVDFESSSSNYAAIADNPVLSITGSLTISGWIKPESATAASIFPIATKGASYALVQYGDEVRMYIGNTSNYKTTNTANLQIGTWYHVLGSYNASTQTISIYINGQETAGTVTGTIPGSISDGSSSFSVGRWQLGNTVQYPIAGGPDDGIETNNSTWSSISNYNGFGYYSGVYNDTNAGMRFAGIYIPQGTTITDAYITVDANSANSAGSPTSTFARIYADDVNSAAAWGSASRPSQITQTTAYVSWNPSSWTTGLTDTPSLTAVVQEIIDRPGWSSGNAMRFAVLNNGTTGSNVMAFEDYQVGTPPVLTVTYGGSTTYYDGLIDDLKVYASDITTDQARIEATGGRGTSLGSTGTSSTGAPDNSAAREYCVPGDATSCNPPVGEWKLDENIGTNAGDTSGNERSGTLTNGPVWSTGQLGQALTFDGVDDYVDFSSGPTTVRTVSFWVYPKTNTEYFVNLTSTTDYIASSGGSATVTATGFVSPTYYVNGIQGNRSVTPNRWSHVTVTTDTAENASSLEFGRTQNMNYLEGMIDDVRLYDYVRTPAQIVWEYNRGKPILWYRFDECTGSSIKNFGSSNPGTGHNITLTIGANGTQTRTGLCISSDLADAWYNGAAGRINSSIALDGEDDYLQRNHSNDFSFNAGEDFSLFVWLKRNVTGVTHYIISKEDADNDGYRLVINSDDTVTCSIGAIDVTSSAIIDDSNWHHVGCVMDRDGSGQVYINGLPSGTAVSLVSVNMNTGSVLRVGSRSYTPTYFFSGQFDDMRIYNYALTQLQVSEAYNGGSVAFR